MPKNRRDVPREERVAEILTAASLRFVNQGYRGTSVGDIAKDVGVATGAIHWYFPTKADLFAATFSELVDGPAGLAAVEADGTDPKSLLVEFLVERAPYRLMHHDAHALLGESPAVAEAHDAMHVRLDGLLLGAVRLRLPEGTDLGLAEDAAHYLLEGVLTAPKRDQSVVDVIEFVVDALVSVSLGGSGSA